MNDEDKDNITTEKEESNVVDFAHLTPVQRSKIEKSLEKQKIAREIKKLSENSPWTIPQQLLQEVLATFTVANPGAKPDLVSMREKLIEEITKRYDYDPSLRDLLISGVPNITAIRAWTKKEGWREAVWKVIHATGMFTNEKRAAMIDSLFMRGVEKDTAAAKIWLTLSGDYVEKTENTNKDAVIEKYREINTILHSKK
jgi:hypothetical protein